MHGNLMNYMYYNLRFEILIDVLRFAIPTTIPIYTRMYTPYDYNFNLSPPPTFL